MRSRRLVLTLLTGSLVWSSCVRTEPQEGQPPSSPAPVASVETAAPIRATTTGRHFVRASQFPLYLNKPEGESAAEIVVGTPDGQTMLYADSVRRGVGFVDIKDPAHPKPAGYLPLEFEPTSLAVHQKWAIVVVDKGEDHGALLVYDLDSRTLVTEHSLAGQPDAIALSPDGKYAAVAIENEALDGFPSAPPGAVTIVDLTGEPKEWGFREVQLQGLQCSNPEDPEPEYLDIREDNLAVVSLQENNHIVFIDLPKGEVVKDFTAGTLDMAQVDLHKDKQILMADSRAAVAREPDSIAWSSQGVVTADEGDLHGGSRSFTIFGEDGTVKWSSGAQTEHVARNLGHYPDSRSEDRGSEPEALKVGRFGSDEFAFVGCERSNLVLVYRLRRDAEPEFVQALPGGPGPESVSTIKERDLVLVGAEVDFPEKGPRAYINIYQLSDKPAGYPTIASDSISWCALSGLAASPSEPGKLYTITDKALKPPRILVVDSSATPARIVEERLIQSQDIDLDKLDLEGISLASEGGFWLVSEGKLDALLRTDTGGRVSKEIRLPKEVESDLGGHGMEGVVEIGDHVYVAFQSSWKSDRKPAGHIGRYSIPDGGWSFASYPREEEQFATGLASGPEGTLTLLLRDKKAREKAETKRLLHFSLESFDTGHLSPQSSQDLLPLYAAQGMPVPEKPEGVAFDGKRFLVVNDNDAMKDSYGETHLLEIPK